MGGQGRFDDKHGYIRSEFHSSTSLLYGRVRGRFAFTSFVLFVVIISSLLYLQPVHAQTQGYSARLTSPSLHSGSDTFVYTVSGSSSGSGQKIGTVTLSGCWTASQIASVSSSDKKSAVHFGGRYGNTISIEKLSDKSLPLAINIKFKTPFGTAENNTDLFVKTSGGSTIGSKFSLSGPTCKAPAPEVKLDPTSITFPDQPIGSTSDAKTVTLSNIGTAPLAFSNISVNGDFAQTNTCGTSVNGGNSCAIAVTFTPTASGTRSGSLTITDNASNSPQTVPLSGTGIGGTTPLIDCPAPSATTPEGVVKDSYIGFFDSEDIDAQATANALAQQYGFEITDIYDAIGGFAAIIPPDKLQNVCSDSRLAELSANLIGELASQQSTFGLQRIGGSTDKIHQTVSKPYTQTAGKFVSNGGEGVGVAIIDSGIANHPDLPTPAARLSFINGSSADTDQFGHGTPIAGIIAAMDNDQGIVGVAPKSKLYSLKVTDSGLLDKWSINKIIAALNWVRKNNQNVQVANISLGITNPVTASGKPITISPVGPNCIPKFPDGLHTAICRAVKQRVTVVASAGNDNIDVNRVIPAAYDEVITVGAIGDFDGKPGNVDNSQHAGTSDDHMYSLSNHGNGVDLFAPGVDIRSTEVASTVCPGCFITGYYDATGTSFAAPFVTGAAALYIATHQGATPAEVKQALIKDQEPGEILGNPGPATQGIVSISTPLAYDLNAPWMEPVPLTSCSQQPTGLLNAYEPKTKFFADATQVGPCPQAVAASPDGKYVYVTNWGTDATPGDTGVQIIDSASNQVVGKTPIGWMTPTVIAVSADSKKVYVASELCGVSFVNDACLVTLDVNGNRLSVSNTVPIGIEFAAGIVASPVADKVYISGEPACGWDPFTNQEIDVVPCNKGMIVTADKNGNLITKSFGPECPFQHSGSLAIDPKGEILYSSNIDEVRCAPTDTEYPFNGNSITESTLDSNKNTVANAITYSVGDKPRGVAVNPKGTILYVGLADGTVVKTSITSGISLEIPGTMQSLSANNWGVGVTPNSGFIFGGTHALAIKP